MESCRRYLFVDTVVHVFIFLNNLIMLFSRFTVKPKTCIGLRKTGIICFLTGNLSCVSTILSKVMGKSREFRSELRNGYLVESGKEGIDPGNTPNDAAQRGSGPRAGRASTSLPPRIASRHAALRRQKGYTNFSLAVRGALAATTSGIPPPCYTVNLKGCLFDLLCSTFCHQVVAGHLTYSAKSDVAYSSGRAAAA